MNNYKIGDRIESLCWLYAKGTVTDVRPDEFDWKLDESFNYHPRLGIQIMSGSTRLPEQRAMWKIINETK